MENNNLTPENLKYILARVLDNAFDTVKESEEHPEDLFLQGKRLAYYEMLDTAKNELIASDLNPKDLGLDFNVDKVA